MGDAVADDPDFRIYASFRDSPKRLALDDALGLRGIVALVDLWCWVRSSRPTGDLSGLSNKAIETAARWSGKRGAFIAAIAGSWLDGDEGAYTVHGWSKRQGWAASSPARSQAGKVAAIVKQSRRLGLTTDQYLDDVGGEDSKNERLRERARQAFEKRPRGNVRGTNRRTNRSTIVNESLPLVSTPSPSPSPTPSPTGGGGRAGTAPPGSSATRPSGASPPGGGSGPPTCVRCGDPATSGPSVRDHYRPMDLDVDLCAGHLTAWFQERDAAQRAAREGPAPEASQQPSSTRDAIFRPPEASESS